MSKPCQAYPYARTARARLELLFFPDHTDLLHIFQQFDQEIKSETRYSPRSFFPIHRAAMHIRKIRPRSKKLNWKLGRYVDHLISLFSLNISNCYTYLSLSKNSIKIQEIKLEARPLRTSPRLALFSQ